MARDNNALIELKKLGLEETADYLGHCLGIRKKGLDPSFVQYVQRASAGIPKYAYLTARKLVADGAVVLTPEGGLSKTRKNPKDTSASTSGRSGGGGPYSSSESMQRGYLGKQRGEAVGPRDTSGESKKGRGSTGDDSDEVEDDGDSEDDEEDEEEEERKEEDEVARHVCDLIEKVRLHREQINHLQNGMGGPVSGPAGLVSTPNDSWTHSAVYDTLPPDVRAPDASSLVLNPPPLSAFDLGMMDEHSMLYGDLTSLSQPGLSGLGGGTGGGPDMPSQMYLAAKYRDRLHGRSSEEDQGGMGADFSDKMHGLADGSGRRVSLPANYTGGTGAGGGIASHRNQQGGLAYGPGGGGGAGGRSNLGGTAAHGGAITGHSTPCNRGGGRLMLGRAADRQRVEDDARISRGKLTRAEFAFLQNAPPWVHLDDIDIRGLALYKKRRWAAARNLDWDSDAECAVEPAEESSESGNLVLGGGGERGFHPHRRRPRCTRYTGMIVKADLQSLPFIPELIANCMFTVERLQPEEQMVAKVASVFPCSFNPIELCRAYPRRKPLEEFCGIIYQLVVKDVLEVCDPPSADDLASLAVSVGFEKPKTGSSSGGTAGETTGGHGGGKTGGGRRTIEAIVPRTKRLSNLLNAQDHIHNNSSSRLSHSSVNGNLRESIGNLSTSSSLQPPPILGGGWPSGPRGSDASISGDGSPVGAGAVGRTSTSSRRESKLGGSQDASLEDAPFPGLAPGHERRPSVMKAGGVVTPQRLFEGSLGAAAAREAALPAGAAGSSNIAKAGAVVSRALWETVLMTDDGSDVFLRFNSIALQRVVSDLLLADERKWLTLVCRRIIALRFTEDCSAPAVKTTRSKAGSAAAASAGASKKKKTPPGEGVVKPSEKQGGDTPVLTEDVSSSNASVAEDKDEEEEDEEEILSGDQPPIPQSLVETALAAERETHEQLARNEEAEAVKEHKEEIERLVSKAVLSRCSSSHTIVGRSLSRKGTSSVLGSSRSNTMNGCNNSNSHMSRVSSWRVGEEEEEHQDHDDHRVAGDRDKKSVDGAEQGIRLEGE
ncbi:adenylate [Cystoisospora suis]|uniref:Adenylate n=1 Tax=Cystoisospora suis TaxID=483139 RepID=A0A2C6KWM0_9APIC|nr:adenylate [Cystoisospora suis]